MRCCGRPPQKRLVVDLSPGRDTFQPADQLHPAANAEIIGRPTSSRPRLKIRKTLAVHTPMPGISISASITSLSGSVGSAFALRRFAENHSARLRIACVFAFESPADIIAAGVRAVTLLGVRVPATIFRRAKMAAAALPETL